MTWNVRYFSHRAAGLVATDKNIRMAAEALGTMPHLPDIIALQEIDNGGIRTALGRAVRRRRGHAVPQLDRMLGCLNEVVAERQEPPYSVLFFPAHGHQGGMRWMTSGLAMLYRKKHQLLNHNGPSPVDITHRRLRYWARFKQKRICAWACFALDGHRPVHLFNTHVSLPAFFLRATGNGTGRFGEVENQVKEVDRVLSFARTRCGSEPAVLVGDFNAMPGSITYERIVGSGLFREAFSPNTAASAGLPPSEPTAGLFGLRYRLDHMFCTQRIQPVASGEPGDTEASLRWKGLSDHRPVIGDFELGGSD